MDVQQYLVMDQIDSRTNEFLKSIIDEYNLKGNPHAKIVYRSVSVPYTQQISDDVIVEVLLHDKLIAAQYQRRESMNWTEVTNIKV